MDPVDYASCREAEILADALAAARRGAPGPLATGRCLNCETELDDRRRWCDADCMGDWERRQEASRRNPPVGLGLQA